MNADVRMVQPRPAQGQAIGGRYVDLEQCPRADDKLTLLCFVLVPAPSRLWKIQIGCH